MSTDALWLLFYFGLYALALYNCYRVLGSREAAGSKLAWIMVLIGVPVIGLPLYYLLGQNRIQGYVRRRQRRGEAYSEAQRMVAQRRLEPEAIPADLRQTYELFSAFDNLGPVFLPSFGKARLFVDGADTFEAIFTEIEKAKRFIFVQYYILRSDRLGLELKNLLIAKAKEGIPVYLLYDDMGSFWLARDYIRDLVKAGVRVAKFLPVTSLRRFFQVNFRNHRKLVVVDGKVAFTGGLNVGEEYASRLFRAKAKDAHWRDSHVRVEGFCALQLLEVFLEDWYFATGELIDNEEARRINQDLYDAEPEPTDTLIQVFPTGPTDSKVVSVLLLLQLIAAAKERLWIATPYFVPDQTLVHAIELAVLRGVDVRILIPRKSDNRLVHWVSLSFAEQLQAAGAKVCLYNAGFMHQKLILIDQHLTAVGTMNFDNRAIYLNFETTILIHGRRFNQEAEEALRCDFLQSSYLKTEVGPVLRHLLRFRNNLAGLAAPLL